MANIKDGSRYTNGVFTPDNNNKEFLILRESLEISESGEDIFLTVEGRHLKRPDTIASEVYGRPELFWVIMDVNSIRQPMLDLQVGQILRIPPLSLVLEAIDKMNSEI